MIEEIKFKDGDVVLITDYCNGCDFHDLLYVKRQRQYLREIEAQRIIQKVCEGLKAMGDMSIVHRDIHV